MHPRISKRLSHVNVRNPAARRPIKLRPKPLQTPFPARFTVATKQVTARRDFGHNQTRLGRSKLNDKTRGLVTIMSFEASNLEAGKTEGASVSR